MPITQRSLLRLIPILFTVALALLIAIWSWPASAQTASLTVSPTVAYQNTTVTLSGSGFLPGETVSVWITYPDYTVYGVTVTTIDDQGRFNHPYLPDFLGATFTPTGRYTYTARGWQSGREAYASLTVEVAPAVGTTGSARLTVDRPTQAQGAIFTFSGSGYRPGERVAIWLRYPNDAIADLGAQIADRDGRIGLAIASDGIPVGRYALTARGLQSGANGIIDFEVLVGDTLRPRGNAELTVETASSRQRSAIRLRGSGFLPGEVITVWATLPDYSTEWLGDVTATNEGTFVAEVYLNERDPVGRYAISAYGNRSERRAVAEYTLLPGP
ncbi:hypothetical protein [Chloroflexus sp.]|uniref:hypothetical protein n=1 Tax=Chloroflexus sp. TaxID=1904827 RepID=UPI0026042911|nr:hypothetical protein [uncultured Chloroflexus sp.]